MIRNVCGGDMYGISATGEDLSSHPVMTSIFSLRSRCVGDTELMTTNSQTEDAELREWSKKSQTWD